MIKKYFLGFIVLVAPHCLHAMDDSGYDSDSSTNSSIVSEGSENETPETTEKEISEEERMRALALQASSFFIAKTIQNGHQNAIKEYLQQFPELVNGFCSQDGTDYYYPLACARDVETIRLLMEHGAQISEVDSPLVKHVSHDRHDLVEELLKHGASVHIYDVHERSLMWAASSTAMLRRLKEAGLDPRGHDTEGNTMLHILAQRAFPFWMYESHNYSKLFPKDVSMVSDLITALVQDYRLDINAQNSAKRTPLSYFPAVPYAHVFVANGAQVSKEVETFYNQERLSADRDIIASEEVLTQESVNNPQCRIRDMKCWEWRTTYKRYGEHRAKQIYLEQWKKEIVDKYSVHN